jgi:hypothetical protein
MAGLRDLVKGETDDPVLLARTIVLLATGCPTVGEMLTGVAARGNDFAISKYFLSFSLESDGMVCRCSQKDSKEALYVKIEDPISPWICLEAALSQGKFTRRKASDRSPTY